MSRERLDVVPRTSGAQRHSWRIFYRTKWLKQAKLFDSETNATRSNFSASISDDSSAAVSRAISCICA